MKGQARQGEVAADERARYRAYVPLHLCGVTGSKDCTKRGSAGITPLITTTTPSELCHFTMYICMWCNFALVIFLCVCVYNSVKIYIAPLLKLSLVGRILYLIYYTHKRAITC